MICNMPIGKSNQRPIHPLALLVLAEALAYFCLATEGVLPCFALLIVYPVWSVIDYRRRQATFARVELLEQLPPVSPQVLVSIRYGINGINYCEDQGVLLCSDGWVLFEGLRTSFQVPNALLRVQDDSLSSVAKEFQPISMKLSPLIPRQEHYRLKIDTLFRAIEEKREHASEGIGPQTLPPLVPLPMPASDFLVILIAAVSAPIAQFLFCLFGAEIAMGTAMALGVSGTIIAIRIGLRAHATIQLAQIHRKVIPAEEPNRLSPKR